MLPLEKQCSKCKKVLPVTMFSKDARLENGLRAYCRSCQAQSAAKWYENGGQEKRQSYVKSNPILRITSNMIDHARRRARNKNLPLDIDLNYVRLMVGENAEFASHCPVFNVPLEWSCQRGNGTGGLPNSPSIDRIDPSRGYVKGNIWVISHRANTIKNDASHDELKLVTKAVGKALVDSLDF
jgi:hypothetical protein